MFNTIVTLSAPFCINIAIVHYSINDDLTLIQSITLSQFHLNRDHYFQEHYSKRFLSMFLIFFLHSFRNSPALGVENLRMHWKIIEVSQRVRIDSKIKIWETITIVKIGNAHSSINDLIASWKQRECTTMHNMKVACNFFAIWKPHLFNVFDWFMILNFEDELV